MFWTCISKGSFTSLVSKSDFSDGCNLDQNNPAQNFPHHNFKTKNPSILKQCNSLRNSFLMTYKTNIFRTCLFLSKSHQTAKSDYKIGWVSEPLFIQWMGSGMGEFKKILNLRSRISNIKKLFRSDLVSNLADFLYSVQKLLR